MSITVKQLSNKFKYLKSSDFKYLTGKSSNIKDDDAVSLSKLATYDNKKDIQIFAVKKEGENFLNMLNGSHRFEISNAAGFNKSSQYNGSKTNPLAFNNQNDKPERKNWVA